MMVDDSSCSSICRKRGMLCMNDGQKMDKGEKQLVVIEDGADCKSAG